MITALDHIGVAVVDASAASRTYVDVLGGSIVHDTLVQHMKLRAVKIRLGGAVIELLQPLEGEEVVAKFLREKRQGIHHICYKVDNLDAALDGYKAKGYMPVWPASKIGASGKRVNFLHPNKTGGVLIELTE